MTPISARTRSLLRSRTAGGKVLVLTDDLAFARDLRLHLNGHRIKTASTADESEGIGFDAVVVTGPHAEAEVANVRVHPRLSDVPIVLVAPGRTIELRQWFGAEVYPVTTSARVLERTAQQLRDAIRRRAPVDIDLARPEPSTVQQPSTAV